MTNLINFLVSEEAIVVYIIALIISILYVIFYFVKKTEPNRKKRKNALELEKLAAKEPLPNKETKNVVTSGVNVPQNKDIILENKFEENKKLEAVTLEKTNAPAQVKEVTTQNATPRVAQVERKEPSPIIVEERKDPFKETVKQPEPVRSNESIIIQPREEQKTEELITKTKEMEQRINNIVNIEEKEELKPQTLKPNTSPIETLKEQEKIETVTENKKIIIEELLEEAKEVKNEEILENYPQEELKYTSITPNVEEAQKELQEVEERLEKEESQNIELTEFEKMQEDTAIISLDELMKKAPEMYERNEETQYKDEGNEPISLDDLEKRKQEATVTTLEEKKEPKIEMLSEDEQEEIYTIKITPVSELKPISEEPKFKSSPVISPVYGIETDKPKQSNTDINIENTANYEKLDEEIRKTNKFIATLKELQKKLD